MDRVEVDGRDERDRGDDDAEEGDAPLSVDRERLHLDHVSHDVDDLLLAIGEGVDRVVGQEEHSVHEEPLGEEVQGPDEGDPSQEAEEEGRVAQRRQEPAAVGHDEDREDDGVDLLFSLPVRVQEWPDEEHRGPGRADHGGKQCPRREEPRVVAGRRLDVPRDEDAPAHDEEREEEDDERRVLDESVCDLGAAPDGPDPDTHRDAEDERHEELEAPLLPQVLRAGHERKRGDRGKERHEREESIPGNLHLDLGPAECERASMPPSEPFRLAADLTGGESSRIS